DRASMIAHWGLGRLLHDQGDIVGAGPVYAEAVRLADVVAEPIEQALIRVSWSLCLQAAGDSEGALIQLDLAEPALHGAALGRLLMQRATVFMFSGAVDAAVDEYDEALALLQGGDDRLAQARLLGNRGIARLQLGDPSGARHDFNAARQLADELGQHLLSAGALHNLGYLSGRLGELPEALRSFELARERYAALGSPGRLLAALDTDQCEVHLAAGLDAEARDVAIRLVDEAMQAGNQLQLAESHLLLARSHLLLGDRSEAFDESRRAAELFHTTGRAAWTALATYVGVLAAADDALADGTPAVHRRNMARQLSSLRRAAATLENVGWVTEAAEVRVLSGRLAIGLGRLDVARDELATAARRRHRGSPTQRAEAWHASALLHVADGDLAAAKRAITNGLRVIDRHRATLGARELRVRASAHGESLARLGVRLALQSGRPPDVLVAAERWRAGALATRSPDRPADEDVATDLAELRRLDGVMRAAVLEDATSGAQRTAVTKARGSIEALERSITRRTRLAGGDPRAVSARLDVRRLRRQLGPRALVAYIEMDDRLHAVVVTPRRSSLFDLGSAGGIHEAQEHLLFAIRRLVSLPDGHPRAGAVHRSFEVSRRELDQRLAVPLCLGPAAGVVVVPTGRLHSMPWGALTTLQRGGDVTISPSAAWWVRHQDAPTDRRLVLVAGTGLPASEQELAAIGGLYRSPRMLTGDDATCAAVLTAISEADVAHLATHGTFRADNPMFSSLDLADGPLMIHDLEHVASVPRLVVLAACHAGRSGVYAGDELLGTATSLLSLGVGSVIAPVMAVPDDSVSRLTIDLHRALRSGESPSAALGSAVAAAAACGPSAFAAAAAFQCIGTDVSSGALGAL
ncbi:MAG: CHAT domain-containing protein, partial [Actinomycetota bacterium]|nr:CHAT domain-containing protein [Actinomycetota bacterium]